MQSQGTYRGIWITSALFLTAPAEVSMLQVGRRKQNAPRRSLGVQGAPNPLSPYQHPCFISVLSSSSASGPQSTCRGYVMATGAQRRGRGHPTGRRSLASPHSRGPCCWALPVSCSRTGCTDKMMKASGRDFCQHLSFQHCYRLASPQSKERVPSLLNPKFYNLQPAQAEG